MSATPYTLMVLDERTLEKHALCDGSADELPARHDMIADPTSDKHILQVVSREWSVDLAHARLLCQRLPRGRKD